MSFRRFQFNHGEAYRLMKYVDKAGNIEWIWNSRDGVTPFIVRSRQGLESQHTDWAQDPFAPDHVPNVGDRIFVDMTDERLREHLARRVELFWDHPEYPASKRWPTKEAMLEELFRSEKRPGQPDLIEVTEEMHARWRSEQERRAALMIEREQARKALLAAEAAVATAPQTFAELLRARPAVAADRVADGLDAKAMMCARAADRNGGH